MHAAIWPQDACSSRQYGSSNQVQRCVCTRALHSAYVSAGLLLASHLSCTTDWTETDVGARRDCICCIRCSALVLGAQFLGARPHIQRT